MIGVRAPCPDDPPEPAPGREHNVQAVCADERARDLKSVSCRSPRGGVEHDPAAVRRPADPPDVTVSGLRTIRIRNWGFAPMITHGAGRSVGGMATAVFPIAVLGIRMSVLTASAPERLDPPAALRCG